MSGISIKISTAVNVPADTILPAAGLVCAVAVLAFVVGWVYLRAKG